MQPKNKVILFADDDPNVLMSMCLVLAAFGYVAIPAENGLEVIRISKLTMPDIIVLNLKRPVMGALDTLRKSRLDDRYAKIPVIIISGEIKRYMTDACEKLGRARVMMKPVHMDELNMALDMSG